MNICLILLLISSYLVCVMEAQETGSINDYYSLPLNASEPNNTVGLQINYALVYVNIADSTFWSYITLYHKPEYKGYQDFDKKWTITFQFRDNTINVTNQVHQYVTKLQDSYYITLNDYKILDSGTQTVRLFGTFNNGTKLDDMRPDTFKLKLDSSNEFMKLEENSDYFYSAKQPQSRLPSELSDGDKKKEKGRIEQKNEEDWILKTDGTKLMGTPIGLIIYSAVFLIGSLSYTYGTIRRLQFRSNFRAKLKVKA